MTIEQRYQRRLARADGGRAVAAIRIFIRWADPDNRGKGSPYQLAKSAAWHAFKAHPELRDVYRVKVPRIESKGLKIAILNRQGVAIFTSKRSLGSGDVATDMGGGELGGG